MGDTERKIAQFANDLTLFLHFERITILEFENTLLRFEEATSLTINYDKTSLYRIGSLKNSNARLFTNKPFLWTNEPIRILGIDIAHNNALMNDLNLNSLLERATQTLQSWHYRGLSLVGKTLVINALVGSLFVYHLSVLCTLQQTYIDKFNKIIGDFLWDNMWPKIALGKLCNTKYYGGLKLIDLAAKDICLKC